MTERKMQTREQMLWNERHGLDHVTGEPMTEHPTDALLPSVAACGNHLDRFPCKTCTATVPVECPRYSKDYAARTTPIDDEGLVEKVARAILSTSRDTHGITNLGTLVCVMSVDQARAAARAAIEAIRASNVS